MRGLAEGELDPYARRARGPDAAGEIRQRLGLLFLQDGLEKLGRYRHEQVQVGLFRVAQAFEGLLDVAVPGARQGSDARPSHLARDSSYAVRFFGRGSGKPCLDDIRAQPRKLSGQQEPIGRGEHGEGELVAVAKGRVEYLYASSHES